MNGAVIYFMTKRQEIADYLHRSENFDHPAVTVENGPFNRVQFLDKDTSSHICIEYSNDSQKHDKSIHYFLDRLPKVLAGKAD